MTFLDFAGSTAVVTGGGSGMGRSIAHALAGRGSFVLVADIEEQRATEVASEIVMAGGEAVSAQVDVGSAESVQDLADRVFLERDTVEVLVNNAGVTMRPFRAMWEASLADFDWMMAVNYRGVVNGIRSFVPRMREQTGHKHIVNTSSMATLEEVPGHGPYTASKAAVDALSDVLRQEFIDFGDDFGVTTLYPGAVRTRIGTSERLRATRDRSATRAITEYPYTRPPTPINEFIEADCVGEMVTRAIELNLAYCLTHPAPTAGLRERVAAWEAGYMTERAGS